MKVKLSVGAQGGSGQKPAPPKVTILVDIAADIAAEATHNRTRVFTMVREQLHG